VEDGTVIPPYYDSLIGKLIVWDEDRPAAIERSLLALRELEIRGVATTREAAIEILASEEFHSGDYSTSFLEEATLATVVVE
jgi:acetyl-CoA carboxylase biotin carboxylase subunit